MSLAAQVAAFLHSHRNRLSLSILIAGFLMPAAMCAQVSFAPVPTQLGSGFGYPYGVAVDNQGNVFVADGNVYEIEAVNGVIPASPTIRTFTGFNFPLGVSVDSSGDVFVAEFSGGTVKEILAVNGVIPSSPTINTLVSRSNGLSEPSDVAVDGNGNVFFSDYGNGNIYEILAVGGSIPASPTINILDSGLSNPAGIALDSSGDVYIADQDDDLVLEILAVNGAIPASPTINTLGSGFTCPTGVAVDSSRNVYVADYCNQSAVEMLAVNGSIPASPTIVQFSNSLSGPWGLALDARNNLYVALVNGNSIDELSLTGNFGSVNIGSTSPSIPLGFNITSGTTVGSVSILTTGIAGKDFADAGSSTCTAQTYSSTTSCVVNVNFTPALAGPRSGAVVLSDASGNALASVPLYGIGSGPQVTFGPGLQSTLLSGLSNPVGMAVDASGNLFVADQYNNAVKELLAAGGYTTVNVLANAYTQSGGFNQPGSVAVDGAGNIFVADTHNNAVKEILAAGGYTNVTTLATGFGYVWGIAVDRAGNVFAADNYAGVVDELTVASGYSTVTPLSGYTGSPQGLAIDASQNIYVTDTNVNSIVEILASGGYSTSTTLAAAGLSDPTVVALDASGNLYVADTNNSRIVELLAVGGYATAANLGSGFDHPQGIVADGRGNIFLTDTGNGNVVELDVADPPSISFASTTVNSTSIDSPHTVQLANIGNQALTLSGLSYPTDFPAASGDSGACTSTTSLIAGQQCDLPIAFSPLSSGPLTESVTMTDNALNVSGATQSIGVSGTGIAQVVTHFSVIGASPVAAGGPFSIVVTALDASNHTVASYSGTVHFSSTDAAAALPANSALTAGTASFLVTLNTAGAQSIAVNDTVNTSLNGSGNFAVNPGTAASFAVIAPSATIVGANLSFTLTAFDSVGNIATGYSGTVQFASSDASATLPASSTLTAGTGSFSAKFATVGSQTITATDTVTSLLTGTSNAIAVTIPNLVVTTANDSTESYTDCTPQTVSGTGTDAACGLRDALEYARVSGSASITFDSTVFAPGNTSQQNTIVLDGSALTLGANTTITGPTSGSGASQTNLVTINGANSSTVIFAGNAVLRASLNHLNITGGASNFGGAGISNGGTLAVNYTNITGNSTSGSTSSFAYAGGVFNSGNLTLSNSTVSGNSSTGNGSGGTAEGAGITNFGTMIVSNCTISGNSATSASAAIHGSAIFNNGSLTIANSTISGNSAINGNNGLGAGIYSNGPLTLTNSTISDNNADSVGGIFVGQLTTSLTNDIVSGNIGAVNPDIFNSNGTLNEIAGNQISVSGINLAPLANYGGTTQTQIPLPGSTAICAGTSAGASGLTGDQRGLSFDSNCAAGAVDAGAVQTNYAISFSIEPPVTTYVGAALSPSPAVQLTENGTLFIAAGRGSVSVADSSSALSGTLTAAFATGVASFGNLIIGSVQSSDALTATLPLNPALSLNLTTPSSTFSAVEPSVQVSVGTSPAGLAFSVDGTPFTSNQSLSWTATSQHTVATTSPQTGSGVSYAFTGWSDSGAISHTVTAPLATTSYIASFSASYQLDIAANNSSYGTVAPATSSFYPMGTVANITATPAAGYYFTGWTGSSDVASSSSASTTITMNGVETITANFAPIPNFVVTVATDDAGMASNCTAQTTAGTGGDASCSLRDALLQAAATGAGNISFDSTAFSSAQTITLANGTLTVPALTTITAPTAGSGATLTNLVTVNGNSASTVFTVNSGVTAKLSGLNITGGAASSGGGIANSGTLTVTGCNLSGNYASNSGGGIANSGTLSVVNSSFTVNQSPGGQGAGIYDTNSLTVTGSTFANNSGYLGGGLYSSGTDSIVNSTFSGNVAFNGGGIYAHGTMTLSNSTVAANTATGAGGIYVDNALSMANSIVAGNSANTYADMGGAFTDNGGNQAGSGASGTSAIAISLAPLANYGGSTQTMLPLPGSPAICTGTAANASSYSTDQRGSSFDANCPSGAVDGGAVQTGYAISFSTEPPASAFVNQAISPATVVQLTESGTIATAVSSGSVVMTDSSSLLGGTDSASFASGVATFSNLTIGAVTSSDTFTATVTLNSGVNITTTSTSVSAAKTTPTITWSQPAPIPYGTALSATQLNATANVQGSFVYSPAAGAVLSAGSQSLSVTFTPADSNDYATVVANNSITIDQAAVITSPVAGTTLGGGNVTFTWTAGGGATAYELWVGIAGYNQPSVYNSGSITATSANVTVPTGGVTLYVQLWSMINGAWQGQYYTYTEAGTPAQAVLTSPTPGTVLPGSNVTFSWTAGAGVTQYELWLSQIGAGQSEVYNSGQLTSTSVNVSVRAGGVKLYARLYSRIDGNWQSTDYTYTELGSPAIATLTSPAPSSTLSGTGATFSWSAGAGVTQYDLWLGTTIGASNVYNSGALTTTSASVSSLPANGVLLYARLFSRINGLWESADYTYTEAGSPVLAAMSSPSPGSVLNGANTTFQWTAGGGVTQYELWLGTTGAGSSNIYNSGQLTTLSVNITGLPTNGVKLYARLWSRVSGNWESVDYTYTEAGTPVLATLTSPTPSTALTSSSATFTWTAGAGPTQYELWLGTTGVGSSNIYSTNNVTTTSATINNLPTTGVLIYARLWSLVSGVWQSVDYTYTSEGTASLGVLTTPAPSSLLSGSSATFSWTAGSGPVAYELWLGTTVGASNVYNSGSITATSVNVTGIPTNGVLLYARLFSRINGQWVSADYTYTEAGSPTLAAMTSPTPGTQLTGANATFTWTAGAGPTQYELWLGTTGVGSSNVYNSGQLTTLTTSATNLPATGGILYARLWSRISGNWQAVDYTYTESTTP